MSKINQTAWATILIVGFIFFGGCDSIGQKSPSQVIKAAYMAANEGKYSEAQEYLSSEAIDAMKSWGALVGGMKGVWDQGTRNGTIEKIEILDEEVRGEGATVEFKIYFEDGETEVNEGQLIKEKGKWKITAIQ